jgi:hypothetical protein
MEWQREAEKRVREKIWFGWRPWLLSWRWEELKWQRGRL